MFTGIIEKIGTVRKNDSGRLAILVDKDFVDDIQAGSSVAVNGACLTVVELNIDQGLLRFDVVPETLLKTNLGDLSAGNEINLERSLKLADRLDGHYVLGHVDVVVSIKSVEQGDGHIVKINFPKEYSQYIVSKGSISIDGVALTIVDVADDFFSVAIIPHTLAQTIFKNYKEGSLVNIEFDVLAKYVERIVINSN